MRVKENVEFVPFPPSGGTLLTVKGFGFGANSTAVSVGGRVCHVVHVSDTELQCRTPAVGPQSAGVLHAFLFKICFDLPRWSALSANSTRLVLMFAQTKSKHITKQ